MGTIKIKRGLSTNLPAHPALGEILYTTDTKRFYVGNGAEAAPTEFANFAELTTALAGKAAADHTHSASDFTNFNDSVDARITAQTGTTSGKLVALDSNGKIPSTLIPSSFKEAEVVADIDARDALTPFAGLHAFVIDASDDETVASGGAEYIYSGTAWVKLSELEDLDVSVTWENIGNKPTIVTTLLGLSDTPSSYTNSAGKLLCVNAAGTAVEYTDTFDGGTF
mgnify:CR=1 FL=1